ncbi:MAG: hypothetical protein ATN31_09395 [Candidatus Epulonipiscioides saccharophilum]|nr:MAG: hypothetical protein ATN31_09395 [Epulopiscium sp. AS2M-Bin001]
MEPGFILAQRYLIIRKLGVGATAIVYKAEDSKLKRFVTIKRLKPALNDDQDFVKRFKAEALAVACISHINVGMVYDVYEEPGLYCIIMEYIEGRTLKELIERDGPFTESRIINYSMQILAGLKAAHTQHVIHRDIKPENIMVTNDDVLKIRDFGMAKVPTNSTIVLTGHVAGSVYYFSPEQAKGRMVTESSDLYALGIIMFEMATNCLPFESDNPISIAIQHINEPIPDVRDFNSKISPELVNVISKATQKSTGLRYQEADQMISDLDLLVKTIPSAPIRKSRIDMMQTILMKKAEVNSIIKQSKEKAKEKTRKKRTKFLAILSGCMLSFCIATIICLWPRLWSNIGLTCSRLWPTIGLASSNKKLINVPNLIGQTFEEASISAKENSFKIKQIAEKETTKVKAGTVLEQYPSINTAVSSNSVIEVTMAKSPQKLDASVPDVVGLKTADAQQIIEEAGFFCTVEREFNDYIEIGNVIAQDPVGNAKSKKWNVVELTVSLGKENPYIVMPNLEDLTLEQAENTLKAYQLRLGQVVEEESYKDKGVVISQDLLPNSNVDPDIAINLTVSSGVKPRLNIVEDKSDGGMFFEIENFLENITKDLSAKKVIDLENIRALAELKKDEVYNNFVLAELEHATAIEQTDKAQAILDAIQQNESSSKEDIKDAQKILDDNQDNIKKTKKVLDKSQDALDKANDNLIQAEEKLLDAIEKFEASQNSQNETLLANSQNVQDSQNEMRLANSIFNSNVSNNNFSSLISPTDCYTKFYTINLPDTLKQDAERLTYHVIIIFKTNDGDVTLLDKTIIKNQFPKTVELTGSGSGTLYIYFDSLQWWKEEYSFS